MQRVGAEQSITNGTAVSSNDRLRALTDEHRRTEEIVTLLQSLDFASGQFIANKTGVSRSAVWKQICLLRKYGYGIESRHGLGYRLSHGTTHPVPWELGKLLRTCFIGRNNKILYRDVVDSTQKIAIALAENHPDATGWVVLAEQQRSGHGRMKRKWLSPRGGIWLSVILKSLSIPTAMATLLPFVAAVAVCDAIRQTTNLKASLKWPNDVMVSGKKTAGILLDLNAEAETVNYAIIGIGINANIDTAKLQIDREGRPPIISLREELGFDVNRLQLVKSLLENIERAYATLESQGAKEILKQWRQRSEMLGKKVIIIQNGKKAIEGIVHDIDDDGSLIVSNQSGYTNIVFGDVLFSS